MRRAVQSGLLVLCAAALAGSGSAQTLPSRLVKPAPDFPPGVSTEGPGYHMTDFAGKVVVLYFFERG